MIPEHLLDPDRERPRCMKCDGERKLSNCCEALIILSKDGDRYTCDKCGGECEPENCRDCQGLGYVE